MTEALQNEPVIFVVDTAQEDLTVAIMRGTKCVATRTEHVGNRHAERVLGLAAEVLEGAALTKKAIELVAFGTGPGSFTGLRVACGVAQGLAWALEIPVAAVSNLEALALHSLRAERLPAGKRIAVLNDARMHECYGAVYEVPADFEDGESLEKRLVLVSGPELVKPNEAAQYLTAWHADRVCGTGRAAYADLFVVPEGTAIDDASRAGGEDFGLLAASEAKLGRTMMPEAAAPIYVRNRVALTMAERAAGERL